MCEKSTLEILVEARALIANPKNWSKGEYARDAVGFPVSPLSGLARSFCSYGAIHRVRYEAFWDMDCTATEALRVVIGSEMLGLFNDRSDHATVLAAFDAAIVAERAKLAPDLSAQVHAIISSAVAGASAREPEAVV